MNTLRRRLCHWALLAPALASGGFGAARAQRPPVNDPNAPTRLRGQLASLEGAALMLKTDAGRNVKLAMAETCTVFSLAKASFTEIDFGTYVGSVSQKLGDHVYSPIVRDSLSWLHRSVEIRIIDDSLRGIALGHQTWDRPPGSVMTHGWIDDMEGRVMSIKYGPTEEEETDVEIGRDIPILRMTRADPSFLRPGARILVGALRDKSADKTASQGAEQISSAAFIFAGKDGVIPPL